MRFFAIGLRGVAVCLLLLCTLLVSGNVTLAQTVTVSPTDLSFGIPTGTSGSPPVSAPQTLTVNIGGSGTVTFSSLPSFSPSGLGFAVSGNSCVGTLTAPTTCSVVVTFSSASTTLATAMLSIPNNISSLSVPVNGAFGAIELFGALNVNPSLFSGVTWPNSAGNPVKSVPYTLSCPLNPTAVLSSTPDGLNNLFQDNTIQVTNTVSGTATVTANVCYGGDANFEGFTGFPAGTSNCFQPAYEGAASSYLTTNPDLLVPGLPPLIPTYGIPPVNLQNASLNETQLYPPVLVAGTQTLTVQLTDAGGDLGAGTVQLVTNCVLAGVTPGGTITGNPITPGDTSSQTQTFSFDNGGGQNVSFTQSVSTAVQGGTVSIPSGTVPVVTDIGIPQQLFYQMVAGTSAAPAVCVRLTGEVDPFQSVNPTNYLCKGYLIQCQDPTTKLISGDNCIPTPSQLRNILETAQFSSPDEPKGGINFLSSACTFYLGRTGTCAPSTSTTLIGPGLLLGGDGWTCAAGTAPGQLTTCTPVAISSTVNSTTVPNTASPVYSAANCALSGGLAGNLCPIDTLTSFLGAADPSHGGTVPLSNSVFVPVVNMTKPVTQLGIAGINANGWIKSSNIAATFTSNEATYPGTTPPANNFVPAPPYSVTYGISPLGTPLPDTTYSVPTDTTQYEGSSTKYPGTAPFIPPLSNTNCTSTHATSFVSTDSFTPAQDGIFNLHYFTTDCAYTEGLVFNPTGAALSNPSANWASFQVTTVGVDTLAPMYVCGTPSGTLGPNGYTTQVTVSCAVTDQNYSAGVSGSGFLPLTGSIQGSPSEVIVLSTSVPSGSYTQTASTNSPNVCDLAGNCVNIPAAGPFTIDLLGQADLAIGAISLPPASVKTGSYITYLMAVTNYGPAAAQGVNITDALPAGTFVSGYTLNGLKLQSCSASGINVTCPVGNLNKGATALAYITIKVPPTPATIVNTINVAGLNLDPKTSNNSFPVTTKVTK
jgi:uncharacterized repeat protein (TIGR01451 family)